MRARRPPGGGRRPVDASELRTITRTALLLLELALLFVGMLEMPTVSSLAVFALAGVGLARWIRAPTLEPAFASRLLLLVLFASGYFVVSGAYGFYNTETVVKSIVTVVALYALGFAAGSASAAGQLWRLAAMAGGFVCFAFLSVRRGVIGGTFLTLAERAAPSFWTGAWYNSPGLGAFASLGLCLLPAALTAERGERRWASHAGWRPFALALAGASLYANLALQNRTPTLALALAIVLAGVVLPFVRGAVPLRRLAALLLLPVLVLAALQLQSAIEGLAADYGLVWRLGESGLKTERYRGWVTVLESMPLHPGGGRKINLQGLTFAHNLWLDVVVDAGVVPMLLLVAFHVVHIPSIARVVRGGAPLVLVVALVGLGASYFATFLVEPTISFSATYFGSSCFALGLTSRLASETEHA